MVKCQSYYRNRPFSSYGNIAMQIARRVTGPLNNKSTLPYKQHKAPWWGSSYQAPHPTACKVSFSGKYTSLPPSTCLFTEVVETEKKASYMATVTRDITMEAFLVRQTRLYHNVHERTVVAEALHIENWIYYTRLFMCKATYEWLFFGEESE